MLNQYKPRNNAQILLDFITLFKTKVRMIFVNQFLFNLFSKSPVWERTPAVTDEAKREALEREPSDEMGRVVVGFPEHVEKEDNKFYEAGIELGKQQFKSMREQLIKESIQNVSTKQ